MLTEVNAKDNDNYFNKHNGSSAINNDVEYAENLVKRIRAGEFRQDKKEPLDKLDSLFHYQGRFKDILEQQTYVTQQLNDSMGVTDKCQPVTILENRLRNGIKEDVRIDGQQTIQGAKNCKYAKLTDRTLDLSVSRVPESVHCHLEDDAITGLAATSDGLMCSASKDALVVVWSRIDGVKLHTLHHHHHVHLVFHQQFLQLNLR